MKKQIAFAAYFYVLCFFGAELLWPSYFADGDGLPRSIAQIEAGVCGALAALLIGSRFEKLKAPYWSLPIAGLLTVWTTLLLTTYVTTWSYLAFFRAESAFPPPNPISAPGIAFVFWVLYFTVHTFRDPEVAILNVAAVLGAMWLIRLRPARGASSTVSPSLEPRVEGAGGNALTHDRAAFMHNLRIQLLVVLVVSVAIGCLLQYYFSTSAADPSLALRPLAAFYRIGLSAITVLVQGADGAPPWGWTLAAYVGTLIQNLVLWAVGRVLIHVARTESA